MAVRIAQNQPTCFRKLYPSASPDLLSFVSTLMSFSADTRYQNLDAVLADLARIQCGEPVLSRVVPIRERTMRVIRRHRVLFTSAASLFLMSTATVIVWYRAERAEKATAAAQKATAAANEALAASRKRIESARKTAGLHLRLLKEHTLRPAFQMPQTSKDLDEQLARLRDAREDFTQLLTSFPDDREIRESAGIAFHLLGIAANRLELFDESMDSFRKAEQIFEALQKDYPKHGEYAFDIFSTALGQSGAALGTRQSFELHRFCLDLIRRLCQQHPDDMDYADAMACVLVELGYDYTRNEAWQDLTKARQLAMEAHVLAKSICSRPHFNPLHRKHIATSASVLRVIELREGHDEASLNWAKITVREQTRFIENFPDLDSKSVLIRYLLAECADFIRLNDPENARRCHDEATERFEAIQAAFAGHSECQVLQEALRSLKNEIDGVPVRNATESVR